MSPVTTTEAIPPAADPAATDRAAGLVAYAKDVIAGRVVPPPMVPTPRVAAWLEQQFIELAGPNPPPTPEARREATDWQCLYVQYPEQVILRFTTAGGWITVLAAGEDDILTVLAGLTPEEEVRVIMDYTYSCTA